MSRFEKHVFVCTNRRPDGHSKGSCAEKGSEALRDCFKSEMKRRGLLGRMRPNAAGCLDACEHGPVVVVYPEGVWYHLETGEDVREVVERHLEEGRPVARLLLGDPRFTAPQD